MWAGLCRFVHIQGQSTGFSDLYDAKHVNEITHRPLFQLLDVDKVVLNFWRVGVAERLKR